MSQVPIVTPTMQTSTNEIVEEKFTVMQEMSQDTYNEVNNIFNQIIDFLESLLTIEGDVTLDEVPLEPTLLNSLLSLLDGLPKSPITDSDYSNIKIPTTLSTFTEVDYTSSLFDALRAKLEYLTEGSADMLTSSVEADMINRETERDALINQEARDSIAEEEAALDAEMPDQNLFFRLNEVTTKYQDKRLDKSRDIRIEARKTAIESIQKGIEEGNKLEATRHKYWSELNQRRLEASKQALDAALTIAEIGLKKLLAKVQIFEAEMKAYAAKASAIESGAQIEVAVIKGKIDHAVAKADVALKNIGITMKSLEMRYGLNMEALKSTLQAATQLCASALASVNAGVSMSMGQSNAVQASVNASENWNHNLSTL